ncbi:MAG: ribonuclease P protein component [Acidimicrobiales bacterium]
MIAPITDRATFRALSRRGFHAVASGLIGRAIIDADTPVDIPGNTGPATVSDEDVSNGLHPMAGRVRVGYAISRRVGNAVVRNRLRRRLRAIVAGYHRGADGPIEPGAYLFIAKPGAAQYTYDDLGKQVESLMTDLRALARATS